MSEQASFSRFDLTASYRCLKIVLEWQCGHTREQPPMDGDCLYPGDPDPSHHRVDIIKVQGSGPCETCESGTREERLKARAEELKQLVKDKMSKQRFGNYRNAIPHVPLIPLGEDVDLLDEGALQARISYLESLLAVGCTVPTDRIVAGASGHRPSRPLQHFRPKGIPHHHAIAAPVVLLGQPSEHTTPVQQTFHEHQTPPTPTPVAQSRTPQTLMTHPRVSALRGRAAFEREFVPGVDWVSSGLQQNDVQQRADQHRRDHGL